jgi:SAM-dependent methyltransferase
VSTTSLPPVFGDRYAEMYDALYASKDYERECDRIETAFHLGPRTVRSVLDLGCGTGNHALPLARRGYRVVGVDRSAGMLQRARHKAAEKSSGETEFVLGDLRELQLGRSFDACIVMFAVLGYQTTNRDVAAALDTVRRHLEPDGILVFDVWNGAAVLTIGPRERMRTAVDGGRRVVRFSSGTLDLRRHLCHVHIRQILIADDRVLAETEETHAMRYFFPLELELLLDHAGFDVVDMTPFDEAHQPLDATAWNMLVVARRR